MGSDPNPAGNEQPSAAENSKNKLLIIIGTTVGGLILIGGLLWLFLFSGILGTN